MGTIIRPPCDELVIGSAASSEAQRHAPAWVLTAAVIGSSMAFIDGTVVNVALPSIQRDLGATASDAQWVVESYALLLSALLLVGGSLGDRYGRRRVFAAGVVLFAAASAACGSAPTPAALIGARAIQGVGAAMLTPGSLSLISAAYDGAGRGRAIGTWSAATSVTSALGPVAGGWLVGHASWRWAFFINLPLAALVLVIVWLRVGETRDEADHGRLDLPGALLCTVGLGALVYALIDSQTVGFSDPVVIVGAMAGPVALGAFVAFEARAMRAGPGPRRRSPMLPLQLFGSRAFSATNILTLLLYAALGGALFFVPFNLIEVHGYSPAEAGAALLPMILLLSTLSRFMGGLVARFGARPLLTVGPLVAAVGFALFAVPAGGGTYWSTFFPASVVLGLGMSVTVAPLTATVMGSVETRHAGAASGVNNAVSRTAGLIAVAVLGTILVRGFDGGLDARLADVHLPSSVVRAVDAERSRLALAQPPPGLDATRRAEVRQAVVDAFVGAFRTCMMVAAGLAAAAAVAGYVGLGGGRREPARARAPAA